MLQRKAAHKMGIQLAMVLVAIGGLFYGGWQASSIFYKNKMAQEALVNKEDQAKKTKASMKSNDILNDFGNEEQRKRT